MDDDQIETAEGLGAAGVASLMTGLASALDDTDEEITEAILDACLRLTSSADAKASLGAHVATTFARVLHVMKEEAVVLEVLFAVLAKIIQSAESQNAFGRDPQNIQGLLTAMDTHAQGEETLLEYTCLVIEALAQDNATVGKSLLTAGVADRLTAAEAIITNVRNKKYVGQARAALPLP
jgi:predicted transcriptional regulator with HTH domain